ncbi:MAG: AraC family transcriptional regulator [Cyclobacteriaceae bacterium]|nr:AraC family transcriptional regulator [Cyclobacteriaceae bacterium]
MRKIKPSLERISPTFGSSLLVRQFSEPCKNVEAVWHFHPEVELVYVNGGSGKRHIGNHLSYFHNGELILIGSNLPHYGFTDRLSGNRSETIVQMKEDFLGERFFEIPEMSGVLNLFERAKMGLSFQGKTKSKVGAKIEKLQQYDNYDRLLKFLTILKALAGSEEYQILNAQGYALEVNMQDNDKLNLIYDYVRTHFTKVITLEQIADVVSMTQPAFCRYFKKVSGKTFTRFVNEYRLVHASKLLAEQPSSITDICYQSGFNNFSHFNKQFKKFSGKSPSAYRKQIRKLVQ